ncbi:uncharacterized protein LOC105846064 [Hydra vulgaris]|uniref:uncharacterized protein LOC105846064 n=1 Tax=Hydra vulgaris TaxID=6087 RepID=UPI000640FF2F|nr:uncharacterized protein LOC105846064 [Hydra vulgaris]
MSRLKKCHWMQYNEYDELIKEVKVTSSFLTYNSKYNILNESMFQFRREKAIEFIFLSNKLEDTISCNESDAYRLLKPIFQNHNITEDSESNFSKWNIDGSNVDTIKFQMIQHTLALKFLCEDVENKPLHVGKRLTTEILLKSHEILIKNAIDENNASVPCGFRKCSAHAGNYVYLDSNLIEGAVYNSIQKFNDSFDCNKDPIQTVMDLFYEILTIHPFADGNGRACRLLAAYGFMLYGTPFPVTLTSGHKRSRRHCIQSISYARRPEGDRSLLYSLAAFSLSLSWANFMTLNNS